MDSEDTPTELVDLLRRRSELLAALRDRPRPKRDLVDDLGVPRSTLDRALRELEAADLVAYEDGVYALTSVGNHLVAEFDAFTERASIAVELEPVLRWIDPADLDLDLRHLSDAEVWTPEPSDPWAMVNRHVRALETADRVRGMLPLVGLHAVETVRDRVVEGGATVRLVVEPTVAETLRDDESYAPLFRDLQAHDGHVVSVSDREIPFFLGVFDDEFVQIGVDEEKEPRALLETDDDAALSWARETLDAYERAVTPLQVEETD